MGQILGQPQRAADPQALMTPVWSAEAIDDLAALRAYIEQDNPAAAQRVVLRIIENVETLLPNNPETGRPGGVPGTRELVIPRTPFNVPYRVVGNTLQILRVFRTLAERGMTKPTREGWRGRHEVAYTQRIKIGAEGVSQRRGRFECQ